MCEIEKISIKVCGACSHFEQPKCKVCGTDLDVDLMFGTAVCPYGHGQFIIEWEMNGE